MNHRENYKFINWAKNVRRNVPHFFQPETEEEIVSIIKKYDKIRLVGAGHSWNEICVSNEALVNLDRYSNVLRIDKKAKTVTVQAGIKLSTLNQLLDKEGLALINLGSIATQSLAGAISTGTHGTGINFQILGSQIIEFTLLKADGEKVFIKRNDDLYNAAIVSLGCLGVISEITLEVTDSFNLHDYTETILFDDVIENLDELLRKNDQLKFWWLPPAKKLIVYKYNRTQEKRNDWRIRQIWKDELSSVLFYRSLVKIAEVFPQTADSISKLLTYNFRGPLNRIEKSFRVFNVPEPPLHRETEWAFDANRAKEILTAYKKRLTESEFKFSFIQEIRFTKADDFWLSPSYKRDSLWIGFYNYEHENWAELLPYHEDFARKYDGRPHWGKEFTVDSEYLQKQYKKLNDFVALKNDLDFERKFENEFIEKVFRKSFS
jgi:D-arabinono-1,4-lactone oxidase/FAD binding domain